MRNKFTELLDAGVASFNYTPLTSDQPDTDPICRTYNNIFSIPSDTHMSITADGDRVITGHMINTDKWGSFCCSCCWGAVDFRTSGTWSVCEFLHKNGLKGEISTLNGDVVYKVIPREPDEECPACSICPNSFHTLESSLPEPITGLTMSANKMHMLECFGGSINSVVKKMNESSFVRGNKWVPFEDNKIVGLVGGTICVLNLDK